MTHAPLMWPDEAYEAFTGDLTVAVAYLTPAGGAVVTPVSPVGMADRATGVVSFATSMGLPKKLERILSNPHVALACHTRAHGFATHDSYVLAQGSASVDLEPSAQRLVHLKNSAERFLGEAKRGKIWDWLLREYQRERAFVDIGVERLATWPELSAHGVVTVSGPSWPEPPAAQRPPRNATSPRVRVPKLARQIAALPHQLLAYRGADGYPVILPVKVTGSDDAGLRLTGPSDLLPPGGRRAGFLAHTFRPQCVGLSMRTVTGWLTVEGDEALYTPHTSTGLSAPPNKTVMAIANGLLTKRGLRRAERDGTSARLQYMADAASRNAFPCAPQGEK
ncbi:hypothetical protein OG946_24715 [Streptomyces sp. NBC_01808]|uniref:hypothetical protein n=1 Tax=Streptomyces sp. NBC_01808 TaxID=2975947 RepID=UPI002DDB8945|nr:hypothetical protein [Streptomyces sp. NBC_01808]WSA40285.1 hypothetical protein OG946_24715 [Streptomyces sp. NBC_01808]